MNRKRIGFGLIAAVALLTQVALAGPIAAQDATPAAGVDGQPTRGRRPGQPHESGLGPAGG